MKAQFVLLSFFYLMIYKQNYCVRKMMGFTIFSFRQYQCLSYIKTNSPSSAKQLFLSH